MPIAYENIYTCNGITENDSMSLETLGMLTEAIMNKRKQIEEKYDVKQLPSDGRWWCKVDGKVIKKVSKEKLIDFLINHDFVFRRIKKGEIVPVNTRCFDSRLRRYCKEAGMKELKSQHDIRRTFATDLYYAGMNLKDIQKIMGHGSMQQTQAYIHFRESENEELLMNAINS